MYELAELCAFEPLILIANFGMTAGMSNFQIWQHLVVMDMSFNWMFPDPHCRFTDAADGFGFKQTVCCNTSS